MKLASLFLCIGLLTGLSTAEADIRCGKNAPQLKAFIKAAKKDLTDQLEERGYQQARVSVTSRIKAVSSSIKANNTSGTFGIALSYATGNDLTLKADSTNPDTSICSYAYDITVSTRYLNTDGKSVGKKTKIENQQLLTPLIYTQK